MKGTQWATLFVLALFLTSIVPIVAADEGSDEGSDDLEMEAEATAEARASMNDDAFEKAREELKQRAEMRREELKTRRLEARANIETEHRALKELHARMRMEYKADKERIKMLREEFKGKRKEMKERREESRKALQEVRVGLKACVGKDTPECEETRAEAREHASAFLNRAAEHVIAALENARERIENSEMSAEVKAELIAEIDASLSEVAAAKGTVATLGADLTKEELKEAVQIIREAGHSASKAIKNGVGKTASKRIGGIIEKMDHLGDKMERKIAKLEAQGKDTGNAEAKMAEFEAKLDAAEKLHAEAQTLFASGDHPAAAEKVRAAHAELKEAHRIMMGLVHELRGMGVDLDADEGDDADEDESDEADEDEEESDDADEDESDEADEDEEESDDADEDDSDESTASTSTSADASVSTETSTASTEVTVDAGTTVVVG